MEALPDVIADSPPTDVFRPVSVSPVEVVSDIPDCLTRHDGRRSQDLVPHWPMPAGYGIEESGTRPRFPGFSFG